MGHTGTKYYQMAVHGLICVSLELVVVKIDLELLYCMCLRDSICIMYYILYINIWNIWMQLFHICYGHFCKL